MKAHEKAEITRKFISTHYQKMSDEEMASVLKMSPKYVAVIRRTFFIKKNSGGNGFKKQAEIVDGKQVCSKCRENKTLSEFAQRAHHNSLHAVCKSCTATRAREKTSEIKREIFDHYGWKCKCCGESIPEFLVIDHIHNDGYKDRHPGGDRITGVNLFNLVKKQGFPKKYQTLCHNCNFGKKVYKVCPH